MIMKGKNWLLHIVQYGVHYDYLAIIKPMNHVTRQTDLPYSVSLFHAKLIQRQLTIIYTTHCIVTLDIHIYITCTHIHYTYTHTHNY